MTLEYLITALFDDLGESFCFADLEASDQEALRAACLRETPGMIFDVFADVHETSLAHHFAGLARSVSACDVFAMAADIRNAIVTSKDIESAIDAEIDSLWPLYQAERRAEATEQFHDSLREAI